MDTQSTEKNAAGTESEKRYTQNHERQMIPLADGENPGEKNFERQCREGQQKHGG